MVVVVVEEVVVVVEVVMVVMVMVMVAAGLLHCQHPRHRHMVPRMHGHRS